MSIALEFENGVSATFSLTAQTSACHRNIHIMCEDGELIADDETNTIQVRKHISSQADCFEDRILHIRTNGTGHGGGDWGVLKAFTESLQSKDCESISSISLSIESHLMAFAIEQARLTGTVVNMNQYRQSLIK